MSCSSSSAINGVTASIHYRFVTSDDITDPQSNLLKSYGPYGEPLIPGTTGALADTTLNASDTSMGWATNPSRKQEQGFTLGIMQMGARVYIPTLGRFLQVDPIEGGTLNPLVQCALDRQQELNMLDTRIISLCTGNIKDETTY